MCLSLIKIRNNSRHYQRGYLPLFNEVPCGHCPECIANLQRDFFLRVYYEALFIEKLNGVTFFMTFTYNNDNIPMLEWTAKDIENVNSWLRGASCSGDYQFINAIHNYNDEYGNVYNYLPQNLPTFNRKHLSLFMKSLRQILDQQGVYTYEQQKQVPVKFYFASEYGEELHRPHYHALFFVPFKIDRNRWLELCRQAWSYQIDIESFPYRESLPVLEKGSQVILDCENRGWFNYIYKRLKNGRYILKTLRGNISYSHSNPAEVIAGKGMQYVSKYIRKTDKYTSSSEFNELRAYLKCFLSPSACKEFALPSLADSVQKLKNAIPFVHTSDNLGIDIINVLQDKYGNQLAQNLNQRCLSVRGTSELYKVPNYILNRIMYRADEFDNSLRVLTDVGVKAMYYRYLDKIDNLAKSYVDCVALSWHLDKDILAKVFDKYKGMSKDEWFNFLKNNLFYDVPRALAIYALTYRNLVVANNMSFTDITPLLDTSIDVFMARFALPLDNDLSPNCMYLRAFQTEQKDSFNFSPCFSGFEIWLIIFNDLNRIVRQKKIQERYKQHLEDMHNRQYRNDTLYEL